MLLNNFNLIGIRQTKLNTKSPLTSVGMRLYNYATKNVLENRFQVINVTSTSTNIILKVYDSLKSLLEENIFIVSVSKKDCLATCTCVKSEMFNSLCRHKLFSFLYMKNNNLLNEMKSKQNKEE